jgi:transposase
LVGTVRVMGYASDLTDEQWALLEPVFNAPGKRGPKHAPDLRRVVDAMLYISHTGCQWRFLPESFGPWTRVWSQFRRWSRNGTCAQRHLGAGAGRAAPGGTRSRGARRGDALDGGRRSRIGTRRASQLAPAEIPDKVNRC